MNEYNPSNSELKRYSRNILKKMKRGRSLEQEDIYFLFKKILKYPNEIKNIPPESAKAIMDIVSKVHKSKPDDEQINEATTVLWKVIEPIFTPVDTHKIIDNFLVPRVIPTFDESHPFKESTSQLRSKISPTSVLLSTIVKCNPSDKQIPSESISGVKDQEWMDLDINTKIQYELESIGLGDQPILTITNELRQSFIESKRLETISIFESNIMKNSIAQKIKSELKNTKEITAFNSNRL
ncbi:hypothetical protein TVAG_077940 [Trichomonas vaginalis G3]|uniref:Uncharacterized protein n=1 Tax=Trichomonas vaginalis (strain ATCC PRA-98 / G3) TaxID=412133 RepID=A2FGM8_TRIV3|nr:hypothetical protein TVAGG3_1028240 [Trichomonas vaginalis G3]EAX95952.1 hypothetical protein TVAG_077940 [Trichomonas vaginalis G3]KAI5492661.1 hypothetical protein TVAGG3_1028240 [Trichomonas vaginalis G3]|eukprot:XP_001308882.1 hypothetical protein [Trichomonas vaginalis G3]